MSNPESRRLFDRFLILAALGCSLATLLWSRMQPPVRPELESLHQEIADLRSSLERLSSRPVLTAPAIPSVRDQAGPVSLDQLHDWFWTLDQRMLGLEERINLANRSTARASTVQVQLEQEKARRTVLDSQAAPRDRLAALRTLRGSRGGNARTSDVVQAMMTLLASSADGGIRADIFRQLSGVSDPLLKAPLLHALRNDPHAGAREEAAETLAAFVDDPAVRAALSAAMQADANQAVKEQARVTLEGQLGVR